jgi:propionyl-CoA carboxylase beta chain
MPQNCEEIAPVYPYELQEDESRKELDSLVPFFI